MLHEMKKIDESCELMYGTHEYEIYCSTIFDKSVMLVKKVLAQ